MINPKCRRCASPRARLMQGTRGIECVDPYACERRRMQAKVRRIVEREEATCMGKATEHACIAVARECLRAIGGKP